MGEYTSRVQGLSLQRDQGTFYVSRDEQRWDIKWQLRLEARLHGNWLNVASLVWTRNPPYKRGFLLRTHTGVSPELILWFIEAVQADARAIIPEEIRPGQTFWEAIEGDESV